MSYLDTTHELYKEAALTPQASLCCVTSQARFLPDLNVPDIMHEMNYGCGTTVHFGDLNPKDTILYVGVGGGLEALQFAYFVRRPNSVIAVDRVPEMMAKAQENFKLAADLNNWFQPDFIKVVQGDALNLPIENESVDVAAQNCLFNIFKENDLTKALAEMYRVLKPGGRLYISDPITTKPIPEHLRKDERLRAMCLFGATVAGPISGGSFNPARSIAPGIISGNMEHLWLYIVSPTMGAICGSLLYTVIGNSPSPSHEATCANINLDGTYI